MNSGPRDQVRSIFLNTQNNNIFMVSIKNNDLGSQMKCRSIPISEIKMGETKGTKVFKDHILQYPDFIEFDDLNQKIVTRHSREGAFRVWDIKTYRLLYVLSHENMDEFKIW